jgi:uroporphyrinogen decarboxylase
MTSRDRVWAALKGEPVDRPPISFWGHFYDRESSAPDLVAATLEFQQRYDWDWIKLNPRKHYHVEPWGVTYRYGRGNVKPRLETVPVHEAADWSKVREVAHDEGALGEQIEAVRLLRAGAPAGVPVIQTVFTPLAVLGEMVEEPGTLRVHMDHDPRRVRDALEAVTAVYERYVRAVLAAGAEGIYLATVDWASQDCMSAADYRQWAMPFDRRILAAAAGAPFNVLHVCKRRNLLLELADYPVAALSWDATDATNPTIPQVRARTQTALMGGISHESALVAADPAEALGQFRAAFEQTGGRGWLAAPSCSISPATPPGHLSALKDAAEGSRSSTRPT